MLFEGRLGGKVYRPIGLEWAEQGYWAIHDHPATRAQYLGIGGATPDGSQGLNDVEHVEAVKEVLQLARDKGCGHSIGSQICTDCWAIRRIKAEMPVIYKCRDIDSGRYNKAITLSKFLEMHFDIVIASLPQHIEPFRKLCALHPSKPKLIYQVGNAWGLEDGFAHNIMASAVLQNVPSNINLVSYHQEFDLDVFKVSPPKESNIITSLVNCFNVDRLFRHDWQLFQDVERLGPELEFRCLGGQGRDGSAHGHAAVAKAIADSRFVWHTKYGGDGYGHIVFNTAAVGRPMITNCSYYTGKLGQKLMIDSVTCICINNLYPEQALKKIEYYNNDSRYNEMCGNVVDNFKANVDFDADEVKIRKFLDSLI